MEIDLRRQRPRSKNKTRISRAIEQRPFGIRNSAFVAISVRAVFRFLQADSEKMRGGSPKPSRNRFSPEGALKNGRSDPDQFPAVLQAELLPFF
jgi:hypothetical protein